MKTIFWLFIACVAALVASACAERCETAAGPCAKFEHGVVDVKTPEGDPAHVERKWCVEYKPGRGP